MAGLSISRAWDETKARIAADGRLMLIVALALIALPVLVSGVVAPQRADPEPTFTAGLVGFLGALLAIIGQLAIIRLAIGPSVSVGEAIGHGARRLPIYFVAILLLVLGMALAAIPFVLIAWAAGVPLEDPAAAASPVMWLLLLLYVALALFVMMRMLLSSPVASAEQAGPIQILRRSWDLTSGHFWRLFGFMLLFLIGAGVTIMAVGAAVSFIAVLLLGPVEPMSGSALIVALAESLVNALVSLILAVMLARIYLQLVGNDAVETVSVPNSGT